ncbi:T9SS type A sorting domain-containing protein [Flaviaesturariibacter amylovorans]|uniref:Secretion system C-terminal sorting domain-containing protein n=1 Tax=Flaviaesturariibacter amylovorans TaxID=1084520 RepID=A0ABP8HRK8_9BACT
MRSVYLLLLSCCLSVCALAQQRVRGQVSDTTGRPVPFATIADANGVPVALADSAGYFSFPVARRPGRLLVSAGSFETGVVPLWDDEALDVRLVPKTELDVVLVRSGGCFRSRHEKGLCGSFRCLAGGLRIVREIEAPVQTKREPASRVYPNPTRGGIVLEANARVTTLWLTDMHGRTVQHLQGSNSRQLRLELGRYAAGTYLLRYFVEGAGWRTERVLLAR